MNKFAVFDIDGTLIRWQLYHVIVDRLAQSGELAPNAKEALKDARMKWKNREHSDSFSEYESVLIRLFEESLPNIQPDKFDQLVQDVIEEYKGQVYTYTRDLITTLRAQKYTLLVISGSHHELVEEVAKFYGFDDWVGTQYKRVDEKYSGQSFVASKHKADILHQLVKKHNLTFTDSYAIGDSSSDAPMLNLVTHPIAFNPDKKLFSTAKEQQWKVVIERKNMIYELEYSNGRYLLAETGK